MKENGQSVTRHSLSLLIIYSTSTLSAQTPDTAFFEAKIRPVLAAHCYGCHSSKLKAPMGGLVLDTKSGGLQGGGRGPAIVPGKPAESVLVKAMRFTDTHLQMPPSGKLADPVLATFEQWIAAGAPDPRAVAGGHFNPSRKGLLRR
jgi:hypothetical protein